MPLEQTQEPDKELKEMQRPIQEFSVSPAVNNNISGDVVFTDNHLEEHSDTSSSGSSSCSSSSCSGSSSESDSDEDDSQSDSHHDCEHHNPEEESQCEDVYSFKDDQENPMPSLDNNCSKKKTASIKVQLKCGKINNIHDVNKPTKERKFGFDKVKCEQCGKRMMKKSLLTHKRRVHNYVTVKCGHCGKQIKTHSLKQHIQEVHNYVTVKCGQCGKQIKTHSLKQHIQDVHKPNVKCNFCGIVCSGRYLRVHIDRFHKGADRSRSQGVKCEELVKENSKDCLRKQVAPVQKGTKIKVKCDVCQKEMLRSNLARHKKKHRKEFNEALIV